MKKFVLALTSVIVAAAVLLISFWVSTGFNKCSNVALSDYTVSEDGAVLTLRTTLFTSMGFIRGFKDSGGGIKPHYLTFYSTFGGLNSSYGAKNEFQLQLAPEDREIYFNRPNGGYELVLKKNVDTGIWEEP